MDTIRRVTREYRANQWAEIVKTCRNSGQTIRDWCEDNEISEKSFYYWQRKFREQICQVIIPNAPAPLIPFAEINIAQTSQPEAIAVTIRIGDTTADIHKGADPETVEFVIRTLKSLPHTPEGSVRMC